jgi:hypothetical protein
MLSDTTWLLRTTVREARQLTRGHDRLVDMGVRLLVVEYDPQGFRPFPTSAPVRVIDERRYGGMVDSRTRAFVGPSKRPVIWFCSPTQLGLLEHDRSQPPKRLALGAEGGGKTHVGAEWTLLRALEFTGFEVAGGCTAPTGKRLKTLVKTLRSKMAPDWYVWRAHEQEFHLANGVVLQLVSTKKYSDEVGSPVQGWTWAFAFNDELQDSADAEDDIETRGRGAPDGYYARFATATAKNSSRFRNSLDAKKKSPLWSVHQLAGIGNVFVDPKHWDNLRSELSPLAYRRRVLALSDGPEFAQYPSWDRERNLRPIPHLGVRDVTREVLGSNRTVLVGHDPGTIYDASILLKLYEFIGTGERAWWVIDELTTQRSTTEHHVRALRKLLIDKWGCYRADRQGRLLPDSPVALVRADPYSRAKGGDAPDLSVYKTFANGGIDIKPAQYNARNNGPGVIRKEARTEMVNVLLFSADEQVRLYVDVDDRGQPVAPRLVDALENLELDDHGRPEMGEKGEHDKTHWPCALGYGLYPYEKVRVSEPSLKAVGR